MSRSTPEPEVLVSHRNALTTPAGRRLIVQRHLEQRMPQAHIAKAMGISRKCVKKWLDRYEAEGEGGLEDRSSRPHTMPTQTAPEIEARIVELRTVSGVVRTGSAPSWGCRPARCRG